MHNRSPDSGFDSSLVAGLPVREILALLPDGVGVMVDGRIEYYNVRVADMLGYGASELRGRSPMELIHPDDRETAERRIARVMAGGVEDPGLYRLRHRDGGWVSVEVWSRAVEVADGRALLSVFRDRTDAERRERERRLLATAVEQAAESVVITDTDGTILYVNPAFERITGYGRDEALGSNPRMLKSGKQGPEFYEAFWRTLGEGRVWRGRMTNRRKDGSHYVQEAAVSPVRDAEGQVVHYVAVARDVTEMVELEHQLRESQKMEALGQITAGVAHDFNNLLTVITANAELIDRGLGPEDEDLSEYLRDLRQAADSGAGLIRQLMTFSRRRTLVVEPVALDRKLSDVLPILRRLLPATIDLEVCLADGLPAVRADEGALEQMLINLATNARDAIGGEGVVTLAVVRTEVDDDAPVRHRWGPAGPYVAMRVTDTGGGMSEDLQSRVFEPLFTTKETGKGTGLGLSVVYGLMKSHGGAIDLRSEPGAGTTVELLFPVAPAGHDPPGGSDRGSSGLRGGTEHLLLVEDNPALRRVGRRLLQRLGYEVSEACDGVEALEVLEGDGGGIGLVVTDADMPRMGGLRLREEARARGFDVPVLLTSGYNESRDASVDDPMPGPFLPKPWTLAELARAVRDALDAR